MQSSGFQLISATRNADKHLWIEASHYMISHSFLNCGLISRARNVGLEFDKKFAACVLIIKLQEAYVISFSETTAA
jgi:hypothetical protein